MKRPALRRGFGSLRSQATRGLLYQIAAALALMLTAWWIAANVTENLGARGIRSGFEFLNQPAGFGIGESVFAYESSHSYGRAYAVGFVNTLRVAIPGLLLATLVGTLVGLGRLSRNWLLQKLCALFVELFRGVPLLVQLFLWYFVLTALLPPAAEALRPVAGIYLSQSGLQFPAPTTLIAYVGIAGGLLLGCVLAACYRRWARHWRERSGNPLPLIVPALLLIAGGALLGWTLGGASGMLDWPERGTFSVSGGGALTPEYLTLLIALVLYTSSYVAEIVRAGVVAVPAGQIEAARALGLNRATEIRRVVLPQALRTIVPPLASQYLNLTKNSSLAVAIGYPDLVSISNTILNQTGRALECIAVIMAVYLTLSLITAGIMNWYNHRMAIRER